MTELSTELQQALDTQSGGPPLIVDPRTSRMYVLLAAEQYERIRSLLDASDELSETYPARMEAAMRAGWADPLMDDYDRYDESPRRAKGRLS
jgi:hypothetical protein